MKEDNIKRILDHGVKTMKQRGYHSVGLNEILNSSGIPKGSFYYYFKSKEDFGNQVINHYSEQTIDYLNSNLLDSSIGPRQRLSQMFEEQANSYRKSQYKEGCLMGDCSNELAGQISSIQITLGQNFSAWSDVLMQCIAEGQQKEEFNNELEAAELADFILNSWEGALTRMKADGSIKAFDLFVHYTMNVILKP